MRKAEVDGQIGYYDEENEIFHPEGALKRAEVDGRTGLYNPDTEDFYPMELEKPEQPGFGARIARGVKDFFTGGEGDSEIPLESEGVAPDQEIVRAAQGEPIGPGEEFGRAARRVGARLLGDVGVALEQAGVTRQEQEATDLMRRAQETRPTVTDGVARFEQRPVNMQKQHIRVEDGIARFTTPEEEIKKQVRSGIDPNRGMAGVGRETWKFWDKVAESPDLAQSEDIQGSIMDKPALLKDPRWWASQIGEMGTSMVPTIAVAAATGNPFAAGLFGGAQEAAGTYRDLINRGWNPIDARDASLNMGAGSAALNAMPFMAAFGKVPGLKNNVAKWLVSAVTESGTEYLEEPWEEISKGLVSGQIDKKELANAMREGVNVLPVSFLFGLANFPAGQAVLRDAGIAKAATTPRTLDEYIAQKGTPRPGMPQTPPPGSASAKPVGAPVEVRPAEQPIAIEGKEQPVAQGVADLPQYEGIERRHNEVLRKNWKQMTPQEQEYSAHHDYLTGLRNRRSFMEEHEASPVMGVVDLDGFGNINKDFGQLAGDNFLKEVASAIKRYGGNRAIFRPNEGGDELFIPGKTTEEVQQIANEVLDKALLSVKLKVTNPDGESFILEKPDFSIGISEGKTYEERYERASKALTEHKRARQKAEERGPKTYPRRMVIESEAAREDQARREAGSLASERPQEPTEVAPSAEPTPEQRKDFLDRASYLMREKKRYGEDLPFMSSRPAGWSYDEAAVFLSGVSQGIATPKTDAQKYFVSETTKYMHDLSEQEKEFSNRDIIETETKEPWQMSQDEFLRSEGVAERKEGYGIPETGREDLPGRQVESGEAGRVSEARRKAPAGEFRLTPTEAPAAKPKPRQEGLDLGLTGKDLRAPERPNAPLTETPLEKSAREARDREAQPGLFAELKKADQSIKVIGEPTVKVASKIIGYYEANVTSISSLDDVAHIVRDIANSPNEMFELVIGDKDGRVLSVYRYSMGTHNSSLVHPMQLGRVLNIPGAAKVWFAHNHPSGDPKPSQNDILLTQRLAKVLKGTNIEYSGHVILGHDTWLALVSDEAGVTGSETGEIKAAEGETHKIPIINRWFYYRDKDERKPFTLSDDVREFGKANLPDGGFILLNIKGVPVVTLSLPESLERMNGPIQTAIIQEAEKANAASVIIYSPKRALQPEENKAFGAFAELFGVQYLDAVDSKQHGDTLRSWRDEGIIYRVSESADTPYTGISDKTLDDLMAKTRKGDRTAFAKLFEMGRRVYEGGKTRYEDFEFALAKRLRGSWDKFKSLVKKVWNRLVGIKGEPQKRVAVKADRVAEEQAPYGKREVAPAFYSKVESVVKQALNERFSPQTVRDLLKQYKVKADDLAHSGIEEFLAENEGKKISKPDLLAYIGEKSAKIVPVEFGEEFSPEKKSRIEKYKEASERIYDLRDRGGQISNDEASRRIKRLREELNLTARDTEMGGLGDTKFSSWKIPGESIPGSYVEHFETVDEIAKLPKEWSIQEVKLDKENMGDLTGMMDEDYQPSNIAYVLLDERGQEINRFAEKEDALKTKNFNWQDGHSAYSGVKNPIVRWRGDGRLDAQGRKAFFLHEIQAPSAENQAKMPKWAQKRWREIGLKSALDYAVKNGYDSLSLANGEQVAGLYDLSKQVDKITVKRSEYGSYDVEGFKDGENIINKAALQPDELENFIGKDLAKKVIEQPEGKQSYSGIDLKVGGQGLSRLYDRDLPGILNDMGKKWGARVSESTIPGDEARYIVYDRKGNVYASRKTELAAIKDVAANGGSYKMQGMGHNASLSIPPSMRESVMTEGQELYEPSATYGGKKLSPDRGMIVSEEGAKYKSRDEAKTAHRNAVEKALYTGKPVPDNVLVEYPELAKRYGKAVKAAPGKEEGGKVQYSFSPGSRYEGMRQGGEAMPEGTGKEAPLRREPIIKKLMANLEVALYEGRVKNKQAGGFYKKAIEEVRSRKKSDLEIIAHEVAHMLDDRMPEIRQEYKFRNNPDIHRELKEISYRRDSATEGFAEFVRHWMTNKTVAAEKAPLFNKWFNDFVKSSKYGPALTTAQEEMHKWFEQGEIKKLASKIGEQEPINEVLDSMGDNFRQSITDDLHGIYKMEREQTGEISKVGPYETARLTRAAFAITDGAVQYGYPVALPNGDHKFVGKGLKDILKPVSKDLDNWTYYAVARSANELFRQGRENLFSPSEIQAGLTLETPEFRQAFDEYQVWNKGILDFAEAKGLISPANRALWKRLEYLPFRREGQKSTGRKAKGVEGNWNGIRMLTGGTGNIRDVLLNMTSNAANLIGESLKNEARVKIADFATQAKGGAKYMTKIPKDTLPVSVDKQQIKDFVYQALGLNPRAVEMGNVPEEAIKYIQDIEKNLAEHPEFIQFWQQGQAPHGENVVAVLRGGEPEFYEVADPVLYRAISALNRPGRNWMVRFLGGIRQIGQKTITVSVDFMTANIARDTVSGSIMTRSGFRPFIDSVRGMKSRIAKDQDYKDFIANGGGLASYMLEEGALRKHLEKFYSKKGLDTRTILDTPAKVMYFLESLTDAFEVATRLGESKRAIEKGESGRHAAYQAREVSTDFAMRGDSQVAGFFYDTVMFLRAGVNGMDRLYRGFAHDPNKGNIAMKTGALALMSAALYMLNKDNDEYKDLPDWDKDNYWHFFIGGEHFRYPKIWEIGAIASVSERSMEQLFDQDATWKKYPQDIFRITTNLFKINVIPQAFSPLYEQATNKRGFTRTPIEQGWMEDIEPWARSAPQASRTLKSLGEAERNLPRNLQVSPARVQALLQGYFNTWATYGLMLSDAAFYDDTPEFRLDDYPGLRRFYEAGPAKHTKYETMYWDMLKEATELRRTMRLMDKYPGTKEFADEIEAKHALELKNYSQLQNLQELLQDNRIGMTEVIKSQKMNPKEKREALDKLVDKKNAMLKSVMTEINERKKNQK